MGNDLVNTILANASNNIIDGGLRYDADGSGPECSSELIAMLRPSTEMAAISNLNIFVV